jgi:ATP-dependent DNA ligase
VHLRSRNDNDFSVRYPGIVKALAPIPDETVIDGEVVALDADGKPSFNTLQTFGSGQGPLHFFRSLEASLKDLIASVKAQGLEGLVAKHADSKYEPGLRSGAWQKMWVNQGQELVIAGYTPSPKNFDALVIGYYDNGKLIYAARTRNGFTPASRVEVFKRIKPLETKECPFANLPEKKAGRWGAGLSAAKMVECRWLKPVLVGQFEFVEWTDVHHFRHSKFVALRDDKKAKDVRQEA